MDTGRDKLCSGVVHNDLLAIRDSRENHDICPKIILSDQGKYNDFVGGTS